MEKKVRHAFIGGSGVYEIEGMRILRKFYPTTPFGKPSDPIMIGSYQGVTCAFLPRHGKGHRFLPSEIPQRANFYAFKLLGVEHVVALSACGSLNKNFGPREFLVPDQIVDRTQGRVATFFGDGIVAHIGFAQPFSSTLSRLLAESVRAIGVPVHENGTYLCMDGPAFSTRAESRSYQQMGCDVIGMTAIPEAKLAREAEMSYALLAMITDYDSWKEGEEVSGNIVLEIMRDNVANAKKVVAHLVPRLSGVPNDCADALRGALFTSPAAMKPATKRKLKPLIEKYLR